MSEPAEKPMAENGASAEDIRAQIEEIKKENLTGQQLRMARRLAQKHGLPASSDLDAVRVLRLNNIDPFSKGKNPLEFATNAQAEQSKPQEGKEEKPKNLPAKRPQTLVGPQQLRNKDAAEAVMAIQRDLIRRRRLRIIQLFTRLFFFVALPTMRISISKEPPLRLTCRRCNALPKKNGTSPLK